MKDIIIEGNGIRAASELHEEIKNKLSLPEYYGGNLDALWDCLSEGRIESQTVVWRNFEESSRNLGDYADKVWQTFKDAERDGYIGHIKRE